VQASRARRALFTAGLCFLGISAGVAVGVAGKPAGTTTPATSILFRTESSTVVRRKVVRTPPVTVTRTKTVEVLRGGDNGFDYGNYAGRFEARGLRGYNKPAGGAEIVGQIRAPEGCDGYVEIDATFYENGRIVDTGLANFVSLPAASWVPFKISLLERAMDSYDVLLAKAECMRGSR
jgi:hypothetical protein